MLMPSMLFKHTWGNDFICFKVMIVGNIFMLFVGGGFIYYSITEGFGRGTAENIISFIVSIIGAIIVWANLKAMLKD